MARDIAPTFRECLETLLAARHTIETEDGRKKKLTGVELLSAKVFELAARGDLKAWALIRDTCGQKPSESTTAAPVDASVIDEIERIVYEEQEKKQS